MYGVNDYGIEADERQLLVAYRAGYRAHSVVMVVAFVGMIVLWVLSEHVAAYALAGLILIGVNLYGLLVDRDGWDEHVNERVQSDGELRRRAFRMNLVRSVVIGLVLGGISYLADGRSLESAVMGAVFFIIAMSAYWQWHMRPKKNAKVTP